MSTIVEAVSASVTIVTPHPHPPRRYTPLKTQFCCSVSCTVSVCLPAAEVHPQLTGAAGCKSYSYNAKTKGCTLSADSMLFDPNAALGVKTRENGYFKVPGLAYFKDEEWQAVNSNVVHSEAACTQFCDKGQVLPIV